MATETIAAAAGLSGIYPQTWEDFIGQDPVKRQLQVAAGSAKMRGTAMGHVLIGSGMAGVGKTALALLTASELGSGLQVSTGKIDANEARIVLSTLSDGDVWFIDEFHQVFQRGKAKAEWMLHLLQDGVLVGPHGPEEQPNITVLAATTDVGKLPDTFISRFQYRPVLAPYSDDEAAMIAVKMATQIMLKPLPWPNVEDFRKIARAGSNNPRTISQILSNLRDLTLVDPQTYNAETETYDIREALDWLGLSEDGLTSQGRMYLKVLLQEFAGCAGERPLMDRLAEPGGLGHIERPLMDRGLVARTRAGRVLTKAGIQRAREEI